MLNATRLLLITASFILQANFAGRLDAAENPNILFIFADDWGWGDLGCHGHPYLKTPNLDRLASEGTEFYQFTVASGVCSPSRAAVMTGHFPARHSIHGHFATVDDPANGDFRLRPDSPALKLGFVPIDVSKVGLVKTRARRGLTP